ncbi:hypothetical protein ACE6H2_024627 [Prunus campanulata]
MSTIRARLVCMEKRAKYKNREQRERRTQSAQTHQRGDPGQTPMLSPLKTKKSFVFLLRYFCDLPCKRTCHGKGRMTKIGPGLSPSTEPFVPISYTSEIQPHPNPRILQLPSSNYKYAHRIEYQLHLLDQLQQP